MVALKYSLLTSYLDSAEKNEIRKRLLVIALPAIAENLLQMLLGIADTAFLGYYDWRIMSGVSTANQVMFIFNVVIIAIATGTMVFASNATGARNKKLVNSVVWHAIYLSILFGLVMTFFSVFSEDIIRLLFPGAEDDIVAAGVEYLSLVLLGSVGMSIMIVLGHVMRGSGDSKSPMLAVLVANVLNVFLDYVFIYGKVGFPEMGARGAGLGTMISRFVGAAVIFFLLFRSKKLDFFIKPVKLSLKILKGAFTVGVPAAVEMLSFSLGVLVFANILFIAGPEAYAGHRIGISVESLSFMPALGMSIAVTALVGMYNGSGLMSRSIGSLRQGWIILMYYSVIIGGAMFLFPELFIRIFTNEPEIIQMAKLPVRIIGLFQVVQSTEFSVKGALRGFGDTKYPMLASSLAMWTIRIPVGFVMVRYFGLGLIGAWIGMMTDMIMRMLINLIRFRSGKWERIAQRVRGSVTSGDDKMTSVDL